MACHDLNFYELIIQLTSKPDLSHTIKAENICETYTFCLVLFLATYKVCKRIWIFIYRLQEAEQG